MNHTCEMLEYVKVQKDTKIKIREELVELNKQTIANQVVYVEAIQMMGDDIFDLRAENEALTGKLGDVDEKWLGESKNRIKLSYDDVRKNLFILQRMKQQTQKLKEI